MANQSKNSSESKGLKQSREKGTTRVVYLIGRFAFKMPRINRWKSFLRGLLANMDERLWYKNSPDSWKEKMCPSLLCLFGGLVLISKRANPIAEYTWNQNTIRKENYYPIPMDYKKQNFGWYKHRIVLVDYADSRYFCSDCENVFNNLHHNSQ